MTDACQSPHYTCKVCVKVTSIIRLSWCKAWILNRIPSIQACSYGRQALSPDTKYQISESSMVQPLQQHSLFNLFSHTHTYMYIHICVYISMSRWKSDFYVNFLTPAPIMPALPTFTCPRCGLNPNESGLIATQVMSPCLPRKLRCSSFLGPWGRRKTGPSIPLLNVF